MKKKRLRSNKRRKTKKLLLASISPSTKLDVRSRKSLVFSPQHKLVLTLTIPRTA